jgi:hypothetical protein
MIDCMRTFLAGTLITVAVLALVIQLALPSYLEHRVQDRLEAGGGTAVVALSALPALSLLAGRGDSFKATGTGLRFDLGERRENPFERLDGFKRVDMTLSDLDAGSLQVERFQLSRRHRDEAYDLDIQATATPRELAGELGRATAGSLGGLMGSLATGFLPGAGGLAIPVKLEARVESRDGKPNVQSARGTVGGVPAGPLAEIVLGAVLDRL